MTVEQARVAVGTPQARYLAALAVVSNGRPLEATERGVFARAMAQEGLSTSTSEAILLQGAGGVQVSDIPTSPREDRAGTTAFLIALMRFALEVAGDRPDPLAVPEALAGTAGLPRGAILRAAMQLSPISEAAAGETDHLAARLAVFCFPEPRVFELARDIVAGLPPARPPKRSVARVSPTRYQHPQDRAAIELINGVAGFDDLTRLIFEYGIEKALRIANLSSCVRVSEQQFPELYAIYLDVVARVGVRPVPELYLKPGGINAHTSGVERPYVMLDAGAVGSLSRDELEFIIGHELGHVRCQHMLHLFIASVIPLLAQVIPVAGGLIGMGLKMAIGDWQRKAEFSCDRVGLLACQDLDAAQRVMIKWSGVPASLYTEINMEAFLAQNTEFEQLDSDVMSLVIKLLMNMDRSHPWTVQRVAELKRWHDEGEYAAILASGVPAASDTPIFLPLPSLPAMAFRCAVCQTSFSLAAQECPQCGAPPRNADRVRRCAACGDITAEDQQYCTGCAEPAARALRLSPQRSLEGPPAERLRALLGRLKSSVGALGLGPLSDEPLTALSATDGQLSHLSVIIGERGRGQQTLLGMLPLAEPTTENGTASVEIAPALDGPDAASIGAAILPADLVLLCVDATQLLSREERTAIQSSVLPMALGQVALVVLNLERAEEADDRAELRDRARRFIAKTGRTDIQVFFPGDPDDTMNVAGQSALSAFVTAARQGGVARREQNWLRKTGALLAALAGMLEAGGARPGAWRDATPAEREEMSHALRQEHALALVQAEAVLAARFAAIRGQLATRMSAMTPNALQHEGLGELLAEVQAVGSEAGRCYLDSFERGLIARAPQPLRRASEGFKQFAMAHLERDLAGTEGDVVIEGRRDRHVMLMALTAVGAGLMLFTGGVVGPLLGALSLAGAHGLRLDVNDRHDARVRANAAQVVESWITQAEQALRAQLRTSGALVLDALQARIDAAMAAPIIFSDAPAETPHAVLALIRQGLALQSEAVTLARPTQDGDSQ
jgi:Zn-dependent protease with chaperone function